MNIKKSLKDVVVLVVICAVFTLGLAFTNSITEPIITKRLNDAANAALLEVMPDGGDFNKVDLSGKTLPATVSEVYEASNGGYVFKLVVNGFKPDLTIMCGIDANGAVTGVKCIAHQETSGYGTKVIEQYPSVLPGVTEATIDGVDAVAGATVTSNAYKNAISDAFVAVAILGGKEVDLRTEEEKVADALPAGEGAFTKVMILEPIEGVNRIYQADNGAGYVCVLVDGTNEIFIGVGADGIAIGEVTAEQKTVAEGAIVSIKANELVEVDLSEYADNDLFKKYVYSVKKSGNGTYVIEIKSDGYGDTPMVLVIGINGEGRVIDIQTVSHSETPSFGGTKLEGGYYNEIFVGKDEAGSNEVDFDVLKNGATVSSKGVQQAVINAYNVIKILGGEDVDTRTEAEKFQDAIEAALPAGEGAFTKYFKVEVIEGIDSIYVADNGAGYVCVIGKDSTGTFIGVDADGLAIGEVSEEHKALVETAVATIKATTLTELEIAHLQTSEDRDIKRIFRNISYAKKTATGNYVFKIKATGYSSTPMMIVVSIGADGKLLDIEFESHSESSNYGKDKIESGYFNEIFVGNDAAGSEAVDFDTLKNGSTVTSNGVQKAIVYCFGAVTILEGGAN